MVQAMVRVEKLLGLLATALGAMVAGAAMFVVPAEVERGLGGWWPAIHMAGVALAIVGVALLIVWCGAAVDAFLAWSGFRGKGPLRVQIQRSSWRGHRNEGLILGVEIRLTNHDGMVRKLKRADILIDPDPANQGQFSDLSEVRQDQMTFESTLPMFRHHRQIGARQTLAGWIVVPVARPDADSLTYRVAVRDAQDIEYYSHPVSPPTLALGPYRMQSPWAMVALFGVILAVAIWLVLPIAFVGNISLHLGSMLAIFLGLTLVALVFGAAIGTLIGWSRHPLLVGIPTVVWAGVATMTLVVAAKFTVYPDVSVQQAAGSVVSYMILGTAAILFAATISRFIRHRMTQRTVAGQAP